MQNKISVIINTLNEEKNIERAIKSVNWADEIIVCDMYSDDNTVQVAKKLGARVIYHRKTGYVEPARNFAISKASNEWILILDADEEIPQGLGEEIRRFLEKPLASDYMRLPRKNLIFGKWVKATMWWPDYNIRLFKKGQVSWSDKIHIPPQTTGEGLDLPADEEFAIVHHHYSSISQFMDRLNRYTNIQAKELALSGYHFRWQDLIKKPLGEFLSRFFANHGFEDGLHGLSLSLLQAFSQFILYLKVWEIEKFTQESIQIGEINSQFKESGRQIEYWINKSLNLGRVNRLFKKFKIL